MQRIYAEQLPVLPLFYRAEAHVVPKWLQGLHPDRPWRELAVGRELAPGLSRSDQLPTPRPSFRCAG